jgi:hypothetical protein
LSELAAHADHLSPRPRIYADANVPAGLVAFMRGRLEWDVLFVLEEDELRRAPDRKHYQLAQQLRRTLVTMDRDYLDDRRFPPEQSGGVLVFSAPDQRQLTALFRRVDRARPPGMNQERFNRFGGQRCSSACRPSAFCVESEISRMSVLRIELFDNGVAIADAQALVLGSIVASAVDCLLEPARAELGGSCPTRRSLLDDGTPIGASRLAPAALA